MVKLESNAVNTPPPRRGYKLTDFITYFEINNAIDFWSPRFQSMKELVEDVILKGGDSSFVSQGLLKDQLCRFQASFNQCDF